MSLIDKEDESDIEAEDEDEFFLAQRAALHGLLGSALCPQCKKPGLEMKYGTKHGSAVKMVLTCTACGVGAKKAWSSPRMEKSRHLKEKFRPAGTAAAANVFSNTVAAVRDVYNQMEGTPPKNVTVVYDGTWMTRGHASHISVLTAGADTGLQKLEVNHSHPISTTWDDTLLLPCCLGTSDFRTRSFFSGARAKKLKMLPKACTQLFGRFCPKKSMPH
ncbi:hypothetical protein HPB51_023387 [Rhipicephalus microplus]|uniref:Uncharacterized protein n=1 Tax=Rhipicephalus microplus TaxID=6941 RepID=A0A9J6DK83_RHIMP|nr:hypothetical protein HPB51_023387 [Rhipicephalus microplus]